MKHTTSLAAFFIAIFSISTGAFGQSVYRCGNTYSQKPCTDGVQVDVQDARTPAQKAESEAAVRREASTANALEKARLQEEAQLRAANAKTTAPSKDKKKKTSKPTTSDAPTGDTDATHRDAKPHKPPPKKKKEPEYFTARGASAEKPKSGASKNQ